VHALSVRDASSRENLVEAIDGVPHVDIVSDGVFDWPTVSRVPPAAPVLGINLCDIQSAEGMGPEEPRWLDILSDVLKGLDEGRSLRIVSLPTTVKDVVLSRRFCSLGAGREHIEVATPGDYTRQLSSLLGLHRYAAACVHSGPRGCRVCRCGASPMRRRRWTHSATAAPASLSSRRRIWRTDAFSRVGDQRAYWRLGARTRASIAAPARRTPRDWLRTHLGNV
jgi:hypothetical protein